MNEALAAGAKRAPPDPEAVLVALVLDPAMYSRNRFFDLHADPAIRRARRRAALVRSVIRHVCAPREEGEDAVELRPAPDGWIELTYTVRRLGFRRTTRLEPLEVSLVRFAIARGPDGRGEADEVDRCRIETALRRLADFDDDGNRSPQDT